MKINTTRLELANYGCIIAIANIQDKRDRSAPTHYHWKILKCRMIIFSNSSILASPDKQDLQRVHVVFSKSGDDYDKLNSLLMKFSLKQDGPIRATTADIFQMCFHYTMNARIAPLWNALGENYLVNNRNFLTAKGPQEGISYKVMVKDENVLSLEIKAVKINLVRTAEMFMPGEWIRVLPSLYKAMVEEHYETLPHISKFRCYKDLRRHWKNIHGYRLPEEEGSYYSVQFWRGVPLLYPNLCVIRNFPIVTPTDNRLEKTILQNFLNCLNAKMSKWLEGTLTLPNMEDENITELGSKIQDRFPDTQAVSLCTPTQYIKHK